MVQACKKITEKRLKCCVRPCEENERGAHGHMMVIVIVRRMLDVDIQGKRRRGRPNLRWKDACNLQERHDRGGSERGQHDNHLKQGRMEEEANQLYRRPQMTGQAREEEEEEDTLLVLVYV